MKGKGTWLFWVDVLNLLLWIGLMATAVIIRWVLPAGSGGGGGEGRGLGRGWRHLDPPDFLGLTRHQWGDLHFWIAITAIVLLLAHLAMHWGWIKAAVPRHLYLARQRPAS